MAIIELNLEKPALKRVESVEEQRTRSDRTETGISGETAGASELSSTETTRLSAGFSRLSSIIAIVIS